MKTLVKELMIFVRSILRPDRAPKVVFYHDIGTQNTPTGTDFHVFKEHMKILGVGDRGRFRADVICFDDGFRGLWEHRDEVKSISAKHQVKVFIAVALVGKPGYLTWDEIRTLNREYGVDFQSHTWSHQTLVGPWNEDDVPREPRTEAWYERELIASREKIAAELGKIVDELCFPVGYFSEELIERCKKAGYRKVYASYPGNVTDDYIQPRCLAQDLSPFAFKAMLKGGLMVFQERYIKLHKHGSLI